MKILNAVIFLLMSFIVFFIYSASAASVYAAQYDLIAPTGQLTRGQDVQFTININTEGQSLTAAQIGMTYKTDALQYVSTTPGEAFTTVETQTLDGGKLMFNASNPSGYSGTGTFAIVTFKIIATASGSTELCVLFAPTDTPAPTSPATGPQPTGLPKTGSTTQTVKGVIVGAALFLMATAGLVLSNKNEYATPKLRKSHKTLH